MTKETEHLVPVNQEEPQERKRQPRGSGTVPCTSIVKWMQPA